MKRLSTLLLAVLLSGKLLLAQSVDDARKSLYYGRTTSAKQALRSWLPETQKMEMRSTGWDKHTWPWIV